MLHTDPVLQVRYGIKLGFYAEMKQDRQQALKEYRAAYTLCKSLHGRIDHIQETKTVSGLISVKVRFFFFKCVFFF